MPEGAEPSVPLAEGLLQALQQEWQQFRKEVTRCPSAKAAGAGTAGACPRCCSGRGWAGVAAGQVWQQGVRCLDKAQPPGSVAQSIRHMLLLRVPQRREMPTRPVLCSLASTSHRQPCAAAHLGSARCQWHQMHMGERVSIPGLSSSPCYPQDRSNQVCLCCSFPARRGAGAVLVLCDLGTPVSWAWPGHGVKPQQTRSDSNKVLHPFSMALHHTPWLSITLRVCPSLPCGSSSFPLALHHTLWLSITSLGYLSLPHGSPS